MTSRLLPAVSAESVAPVREREGWPDSSSRLAGDHLPAGWVALLARCSEPDLAPLPGAGDQPDLHRLTHGGPVLWLETGGDLATLGLWIRDRVRSGATVRLVATRPADRAALRDELGRRGVTSLDLAADAREFSAESWLGRWAGLWDRGLRLAALKAADPSTRLARWKADGGRLREAEAEIEQFSAALSPAEADLAERRQRAERFAERDQVRSSLESAASDRPTGLWWQRLLGIGRPKPADRPALEARLAQLNTLLADATVPLPAEDAQAEIKTVSLRQSLRAAAARRDEVLGEWFDGPMPALAAERAGRWAALGTDLGQQSDARRKAVEERFDALIFDPPEWMASGLADAPVSLSDCPEHPRLRPADHAVVLGADALSTADLCGVAGLAPSLLLVGPAPAAGPAAEVRAAISRHPWVRCGPGWQVELQPCAAPEWEPVADRPEILIGVDPGPNGGIAAVRFPEWSCPWTAWTWLAEEIGPAPLPPCPAESRLVTHDGQPELIWDPSAENPDWKRVGNTPVELGRNESGAVGLRFPADWGRSEAAAWLREAAKLRLGRVLVAG